MPSADGPQGPSHDLPEKPPPTPSQQTMELQLFESLVHHLIEKGILTRNDVLSVVQTVAEVKRGLWETAESRPAAVEAELVVLERLYSSFELVSDRPITRQAFDGGNVLQLRPPVHGDNPEFPRDV